MFKEKFSFYFGVLILFIGCETLDPLVEVPAYIYVDTFDIRNDYSSWDEDIIFSKKITDVWVYAEGTNLQGAYELPATIPINRSGTGKLTLRAGIKNAGIGTSRAIYPFYKEFEIETYKYKTGVVDTIEPHIYTHYRDDPNQPIQLVWQEDFDDNIGGYSFHHKSTSDTTVQIIEDSVLSFRGDQCGGIFLDEDAYFFEMISPSIKLPRSAVPVYMELNYKTDHEFYVGLYLDNKGKQISLYVVKERENWNKIYFDFTSLIQSNFNAADFNVFIGFEKKDENPIVEMYIDNIKLLHY